MPNQSSVTNRSQLTYNVVLVEKNKNLEPTEILSFSTNAIEVHHRLSERPEESNDLSEVGRTSHEVAKGAEVDVNRQTSITRSTIQRKHLYYSNDDQQLEDGKELPAQLIKSYLTHIVVMVSPERHEATAD